MYGHVLPSGHGASCSRVLWQHPSSSMGAIIGDLNLLQYPDGHMLSLWRPQGASMENFEIALACVLSAEGAWSADPTVATNWTGNKIGEGEMRGTKYAICAAAYPDVDITNLTRDQARTIHRAAYWDTVRGDELPVPIAIVAFDCALTQGVDAAIRLLQEISGVRQTGVFDNKTLAAVLSVPERDAVLEMLAQRATVNPVISSTRRIFRLASLANAVARQPQAA